MPVFCSALHTWLSYFRCVLVVIRHRCPLTVKGEGYFGKDAVAKSKSNNWVKEETIPAIHLIQFKEMRFLSLVEGFYRSQHFETLKLFELLTDIWLWKYVLVCVCTWSLSVVDPLCPHFVELLCYWLWQRQSWVCCCEEQSVLGCLVCSACLLADQQQVMWSWLPLCGCRQQGLHAYGGERITPLYGTKAGQRRFPPTQTRRDGTISQTVSHQSVSIGIQCWPSHIMKLASLTCHSYGVALILTAWHTSFTVKEQQRTCLLARRAVA